MDKMLNPNGRRMLSSRPRPRTILLIAVATITTYYLLFSGPSHSLRYVPYIHDKDGQQFTPGGQQPNGEYFDDTPQVKNAWDIDIEDIKGWRDPDDKEDPDDVEPGYETDGKVREPGDISKTQYEKDMRKMWRYAYKVTAK